MPDSKEQKITDAIVERLQTILTANGYQTNIGVNVRDWETNWQQEQLPAISVYQNRTQSEDAPTGRRQTMHVVPFVIVVNLERGTESAGAANARQAISDVKCAIRGGPNASRNEIWERWPDNGLETGIGLAMWTKESGHTILTPQESFEIVGVQIDIDVMYITQKFNSEE